MAPPPTTVVSPVVALLVRVLTFACLLISIVILTTNTATLTLNFAEIKLRFKDIYAYRYMVASIVFGIVYTLLQIAFTIYQVSTGNRLGGDGIYLFDFYGDKLISYVLATGTGAGFGVTKDLKAGFAGTSSSIDEFFNKGYAAASILLFAFLFSAVSSIFSSLSLPKRS
ncbi:hypothetical protein LguiA_023676 [Lonicera macranthoides]